MTNHEAKWIQLPDLDTKAIGQYYCSKCKLQLEIGFNLHYEQSATGWYWEISDSSGQVVDSMGNRHAFKYEPGIGMLEEIKTEGIQRLNSLDCRRSN